MNGQRRTGAEAEGIAVGFGRGHGIHAVEAGRAHDVLHGYVLTEELGHFRGEQTYDDVGFTARAEGDDHGDGTFRIVGGVCVLREIGGKGCSGNG